MIKLALPSRWYDGALVWINVHPGLPIKGTSDSQ